MALAGTKEPSPPGFVEFHEDDSGIVDTASTNTERALWGIKKSVDKIGSKIEVFEQLQLEKETASHTESEWRVAAVILDKMLLLVFLFLSLAIFCIFLSTSIRNYSITEDILQKHRD